MCFAKAFTVNKKQAEEIFRLADEDVLVTEAIWTLYAVVRLLMIYLQQRLVTLKH